MRITPQQLQIQLKDIQSSSKGQVNLKAGTNVLGKVLAVQSEAILIQLQDGSSSRAIVDQPDRFNEGTVLDFKVLESGENELPKLSIMTGEDVSKQIKTVLSQVDISPSQESVKAYEVLKALDLNITKDSINTLTDNFKFLSTFNKSVEQLINEPIKMEQLVLPEVKDDILIKVAKELGFESIKEFKEANFKEVVIKSLELPSSVASDNSQSDKRVSNEVIKTLFSLMRDDQGQVEIDKTMEKLGQLMKLEKPMTFKQMTTLDKLTFDESKISEQIKEVLEDVVKLPLENKPEKLLALLKGFNMEKLSDKAFVKEYFNEIASSLDKLIEELPKSRLRSSSEQLLESVQFLDSDQENLAWIQMPIQMNQTLHSVDVYFKQDKKSGQKMTKDNAKILIALNTDYLDLVQAVVEVKGQVLDIGFKVRHDSVKELIESQMAALGDYFDMYQVNLHVENREKISLTEFVEVENSHFINMKV